MHAAGLWLAAFFAITRELVVTDQRLSRLAAHARFTAFYAIACVAVIAVECFPCHAPFVRFAAFHSVAGIGIITLERFRHDTGVGLRVTGLFSVTEVLVVTVGIVFTAAIGWGATQTSLFGIAAFFTGTRKTIVTVQWLSFHTAGFGLAGFFSVTQVVVRAF